MLLVRLLIQINSQLMILINIVTQKSETSVETLIEIQRKC